MQNNKTYSEIISEILTKEDLIRISSDLDLLEKSLYMKKKDLNISPTIVKAIENQEPKSFIATLRQELSKIKILEITISFPVTQKTIVKISDWITNNIDQKIALDIKIDPSIIAGAIISFNGKYANLSLKSKLENILKNYV